jgi:hypothetical protein
MSLFQISDKFDGQYMIVTLQLWAAKIVIATPLKSLGSNLPACGIAGGTGILPVISE